MVRALPLCWVPIPVGLRRWWGLLTHTPSLIPSTPRRAAEVAEWGSQSPCTRPTSLLSFTSRFSAQRARTEHAHLPGVNETGSLGET